MGDEANSVVGPISFIGGGDIGNIDIITGGIDKNALRDVESGDCLDLFQASLPGGRLFIADAATAAVSANRIWLSKDEQCNNDYTG